MNNKIVNLTPHTITIVAADGTILRKFPPSGEVARATETSRPAGNVEGIQVFTKEYGVVENLPAPELECGCEDSELECGCSPTECPSSGSCHYLVPATYYIVSLATATAAQRNGRTTIDLLLTNNPVRDKDGNIVGCSSFARL